MKKLFALINPRGKSKKQVSDELWRAFGKHEKAEKEPDSEAQTIDEISVHEGEGFTIGYPTKPKDSDNQAD